MIKRLLKKCHGGSGGNNAGENDASGEIDVIKMLASDVANALGAGTGGNGDMGGKRDRKGEGGRLATELLDAQNDSDSAIMLEDHLTEVGTSSL